MMCLFCFVYKIVLFFKLTNTPHCRYRNPGGLAYPTYVRQYLTIDYNM